MQRLSEADFEGVFRLLETSFPLEEYRTREEQRALLSEPAYTLFGIKEEDRVIAFMAVWELPELLFIEHLAVDPAYRNGGMGAGMLREIVEMSDTTVCLEVEPPRTEMAARRIGFYRRNGFFLNEYPYIQPAMSKGRNPIPLQVMTGGHAVDREEFENIKNRLYTWVYKVKE